MQRRDVVTAVSLAAAGIVAPMMAAGEEQPAVDLLPRKYDDFSVWLASAQAAGMRYLRDYGRNDTERFMKLLGLWVSAMPATPAPNWQVIEGANARLEMATLAAGRPFVVSAFRMAPGCVLPAHCHPGGGGITMCRRGAVTIQHFDLAGDQPAFSETGATVRVRAVSATQLRAEQETWFTPTQSNVHRFVATSEGAEGVEIAAQWAGGGEFSFLKLAAPPEADSFQAGQILSGSWTGMRIADAYL